MILTANGRDIRLEFMTFPDGQRHVKLLNLVRHGDDTTIMMAIRTPQDLFDLCLVREVLYRKHCRTNLNITYLLGARMDRRIDEDQPSTLAVVAHIIGSLALHEIRVLDPHSEVSLALLEAEAVFPIAALKAIFYSYEASDMPVIIIPDAGAVKRVNYLLDTLKRSDATRVQASKRRDTKTGQLSNFTIDRPDLVEGKKCLIIDDICDGGRTFQAISEILHKCNCQWVDLFVTHGIFSNGVPVCGIHHIYTTNSYQQLDNQFGVTVFPITRETFE